jgi:hypothetical protein
MTLHNFEIYYLAAVNCDPAISVIISIRVNIYPGPGEQKKLNYFYLASCMSLTKRAGSECVIPWYGFADPDPDLYQNVMDREQCHHQVFKRTVCDTNLDVHCAGTYTNILFFDFFSLCGIFRSCLPAPTCTVRYAVPVEPFHEERGEEP